MARTLPQHLYQHLKHRYGIQQARIAHILPEFCFSGISFPDELAPAKTATDSARGELFSYWQLFGQLKNTPDGFASASGLMLQLPSLIRGFALKDTLTETGLSYACSAQTTNMSPDDFPNFMRCCATWFQQDEHGPGSLAWAMLAKDWLRHFSRVFPSIATETINAHQAIVHEGTHGVVAYCPSAVDPEFLRCCLSATTHKLVMVAIDHDAKTGVFSLHISREDRLELLDVCAKGAPTSLSVSGVEFSLHGPATLSDDVQLYSADAAFSEIGVRLINELDVLVESFSNQRPVLTVAATDLIVIDKLHEALRLDHKKAKNRQIPAQILLMPEQTYCFSIGSSTELTMQLRDLIESPAYQHVNTCTLWASSDRTVSVPLSLSWVKSQLRNDLPLCARVFQQSPGRFIMRGRAHLVGVHPFPQANSTARRDVLHQFQNEYTKSTQYIRDPLSPAQRRDAISSLGDVQVLDREASTALTLWMQRRGVQCHASFESYSDPVSGVPFFVSMNLYRPSSQGIDCRSVSVFIQSMNGMQITLSEEAVQMGYVSNEELAHVGISAEEADYLLCKALDRATLSQGGALSSQWENATHQSRQLMPALPLLMERVARSSPLDSTRLIRDLQLTAFPTHLVDIDAGPGVRASFHDAWRGKSPLTLHGFLSTPNAQALSSSCGRFVLQKDGEHFLLFDQDNLSAHPVLQTAQDLCAHSLMHAKSSPLRQSPSKTGELLDRYKVSVLIDQFAPAMVSIGVFEIPQFIPAEHHIHEMRHTLIATFSEWSQIVDFKLPVEVLVEQFNAILPPKLSGALDVALCGGEGSQSGRTFLAELLQSDPRLLEAVQYGNSKRDLLQAISTPAARLDPADTVFSMRHLIRWNILRFFENNPARTAHYHQMPVVLALLSELEPNTKIAPQDLLRQLANRFVLPLDFVQQVYSQAYAFQSADPCQQDFLPSRKESLPLHRELLRRDWVIWSGAFRRGQSASFFPDLEPLLHTLGRDQVQTQIQWWVEKELHPALRLSQRSQAHRHSDANKIRLRPELLDGHQQFIEIAVERHISDQTLREHVIPSLNATLSLLRLQNSLGQVHLFARDDLTFSQDKRQTLLSSIIGTLQSSEASLPLFQLDDICQQLRLQSIRVVDEGPLLQLFQAWSHTALLGAQAPSPRALSPDDAELLQAHVAQLHIHLRGRPLSESAKYQLNDFSQRSIQLYSIADWAKLQIRNMQQKPLLTDDTATRNSHWQSVLEQTKTPFNVYSKQQLVASILSSGPLSCSGLSAADELALEVFASTGRMPAHGTPAKAAVQALSKACLSLRVIELSPTLSGLSESFTLKAMDVAAAFRQFQQKYPSIQPLVCAPSHTVTPAHQLPDKPGS